MTTIEEFKEWWRKINPYGYSYWAEKAWFEASKRKDEKINALEEKIEEWRRSCTLEIAHGMHCEEKIEALEARIKELTTKMPSGDKLTMKERTP